MKQLSIIICMLFCSIVFSQKSVPNSTLFTLDGKSLKVLDEISKNKITVLSFWATWCVPCINELDDIHKEIEKWENANVKIVAISTDDSRTKRRVRPMVNGKKWNFEILLDENQALKRALNINAIPHTIVTKGTRIIYRRIGYKPGEENHLYEFILKNSTVKN